MTGIWDIVGRSPVLSTGRDISLFIGGEAGSRKVTVGRPTRFDDVLVAISKGRSVSSPSATVSFPVPAGTLLRQTASVVRAYRSRVVPPLSLPTPFIDFRAIEPNNVAHLILGAIPVLLHAQAAVGDISMVVRKIWGPFRALVEDQFGIPIVATDKRVSGQQVKLWVTRTLQCYDIIGISDCNAASLIPNVFGSRRFARGGEPEKIFIARRGVRAVRNQAAVEAILRPLGYETVYMEDYPVDQQLAIAQAAKHVVAVHGAASGLLVVNGGLQSMVELCPPNTYHEVFPVVINCPLYSVVVSSFDQQVPLNGFGEILKHKNAPAFDVDIAALEAALEHQRVAAVH